MKTFSFLQSTRQRSSANNFFRQKRELAERENREQQLKDAMSLIEETKRLVKESNALIAHGVH